MTSSILRIILTTWVASNICCCFPIKVSNTFCSRMSFVPTSLQSIPHQGLFSCIRIWQQNKIISLELNQRSQTQGPGCHSGRAGASDRQETRWPAGMHRFAAWQGIRHASAVQQLPRPIEPRRGTNVATSDSRLRRQGRAPVPWRFRLNPWKEC